MLVLDAGAFIAAERGTPATSPPWSRTSSRLGRVPLTNGAVIAQIWRGGTGRQVKVARLLDNVEIVPVDDRLGKRAGMLPGPHGCRGRHRRVRGLPCPDGDDILTSDPRDLLDLVRTAGVHVELIPV